MTRFADLPLFASDAELADAVFGKDAHLWKKLAPLYEVRELRVGQRKPKE